jgi:tRNA (guanine-N7-)-methyltransferase
MDDARERGRFFGRSKGKALREGQSAALSAGLARLGVPADGPVDPAALFPGCGDIRLEIGFGGGEHLLHRAAESPEAGFIGVEPFVNGMAKLLLAADRLGLANIRVHDRDAGLLLPRLPEAYLSTVYLLYPDPWPKRRQRKRRFVSAESLAALARVVRPGGRLLFATDIDDYAGWTLARVAASPHWRWQAAGAGDWKTPFEGWVRTRYEAKAVAAGRCPSYLTFTRGEA